MKVGALVRYRGWGSLNRPGPLGVVINQRSKDSDFHHRVRVMWLGEKIPVEAHVLSTKGSRITSWCKPGHFQVIEDPE